MLKIGKYLRRISTAVSMLSYGGIFAIMILNVIDVFTTKVFLRTVTGAYEITEMLLLITVFTAFAYGQTERVHIHITMLIKHFPRPVKFSLYGLMGLLSAFVAGLVGYAAVIHGLSALAKGSVTAVLMIPMYPFYFVESVAMFGLAIVLLYDALVSFVAIGSDECAEFVTSDWA